MAGSQIFRVEQARCRVQVGQFGQTAIDRSRIASARRRLGLERRHPFGDQWAHGALDDQSDQFLGRVVGAGRAAPRRIGGDDDAAVLGALQAVFQDLLVDGAQLLHGEVAVVDVARRPAGLVAMGKAEHDIGHDRIVQARPLQQRCRTGIEQPAIVGRDAQIVVTIRDGAEDRLEPGPEGRGRGRERPPGRHALGDVLPDPGQAVVRVVADLIGQQVAIFGEEHEQDAVEQDQRRLAQLGQIVRPACPVGHGIGLGQAIGQLGEHLVEHLVGQVVSDARFPLLALLQGDRVEAGTRFRGQERLPPEQDDEQLEGVATLGGHRLFVAAAPIEQVQFAARQVEGLAEVDLQEVFGDRQGALEIEPPAAAVGQDPPTQPAFGNVVDPAQVAQHLGGGHAVLALGLPIQDEVPLLGFHQTDAVAKSLPGIGLRAAAVEGVRIAEQ